jgi:hypothetical protein
MMCDGSNSASDRRAPCVCGMPPLSAPENPGAKAVLLVVVAVLAWIA